MITASDLVNLAEEMAAQSQARSDRQQERLSNPQKNRVSTSIKSIAFCAVLFVSVIIWASANKSVTGRHMRIWDFLTGNKLVVTGIVCNDQSRTALVRGRLVHEGDIIGKYKVAKIRKDRVDFEKDGEIIVRRPGR